MAQSPVVQQLMAEADALSAVLSCVEGGPGGRERAAQLVEDAYRGHDDRSPEGVLTLFAMERVVGFSHGDPPRTPPVERPYDRHLFEMVALAWIRWATGTDLDRAREDLQKLGEDGGYQPHGGALHMMALRPWQMAVEALIRGDRQEARRLFKRATELGSQCGTETNPSIQWAYAATFFVG